MDNIISAYIDGEDIEFLCDIEEENAIETVGCIRGGTYDSIDIDCGPWRRLLNIQPIDESIRLGKLAMQEAWNQIEGRLN